MAEKDEKQEKNDDNIKVMTLNCFGLYVVSKHRRQRMQAIGEYLAGSDYDIVLLQEVWCNEDYDLLESLAKPVYPHCHYFDQGIIGSGTCIFTKHRISNANYHEYSMNGYPTKFWHGDWYAAKGLGVCQMDINGFNVTVFTSHYHAEYDPKSDMYLGHRVIHGLESAQWLNMTSAATDLTLYCGDFNTEPSSVPYKLLKGIVPLNDAWAEYHGEGDNIIGGETCEVPGNSFVPASVKKGKRIDYIMYRAGPGCEASTANCWHPLENRVPGKEFSYSDHEAVAAEIKMLRTGCGGEGDVKRNQSAADFRRSLSVKSRNEVLQAVNEATVIIDKSLRKVDFDKIKYGVYSFGVMLFLILTFIPSSFIPDDYYVYFDLGMFLPRFVATIFFVIFVLMASLYNKKERNALKSTKKELALIINQEFENVV